MRASLVLLSLLAVPAVHAATPCDAPDQFVRPAKQVSPSIDPAPLLRPYVIEGMAALSVRELEGERWLELAVFSADDARRRLAGSAAGGIPTLATWQDRVWLRCPGGAPRA